MGLGSIFLGLVATLVALLAPTVIHYTKIGGPFLVPNPTVLPEGHGPIYIDDTVHCEDVHYYSPANLLFTACEDEIKTRFDWFPGLGHLEPEAAGTGSIHVIDPKTMKSTRLSFQNFNSKFITHGIDVIADPQNPNAVYIFAINHLPNPDFLAASAAERIANRDIPTARSQVELFHHVLHSGVARHVRSIRHELVYTPNDVVAVSPDEFYVTNDHYYRDGLMRSIEDLWPFAKWSYIVRVVIEEQTPANGDAGAGLSASIAHRGLWNNNGLGHGASPGEVIVSSAIGGELYLGNISKTTTTAASGTAEGEGQGDGAGAGMINVHTTIPFETVTDNPSYFKDIYADSESGDASGIVVAGITQGIYLGKTGHDINGLDPLQVWFTSKDQEGKWVNRLLFEDDSLRIRSASAAVLVPIEPVGGVKQAWLFVTGFLSEKMIAVKLDL